MLLEAATPAALEPPPFAEIAARAEARPTHGAEPVFAGQPERRTRPGAAWTRRLAWAASVVIALGMREGRQA